MKKILKKIWNIFLDVVIGSLVLIIALSLIGKKTNKQILPYSMLWVLSASMEDTIPMKSYILVKKCKASDVEVGDVITFISEDPAIYGQYNTHRVIEVIGDHEEFRTKGDNNPSPDTQNVKADHLVAKYVCNLKVMTACGRVYSSQAGIYVTTGFIMGGAGILLACLSKHWKKQEKEEQMKELVAKEVEKMRLIDEEVKRLKEQEENKTSE